MIDKKIFSTLLIASGLLVFWANGAWATTWYVRDGGGDANECTGTTNAVYPGTGSGQECAFNHPRIVFGYCTGNENGGSCQVQGVLQAGDYVYIDGDSDLNPGSQAQYEMGFDDVNNGALTPQCNAAYAYACDPAPIPGGLSPSELTGIIGTGTHQPQLWGTQGVSPILNLINGNYDVENLEITQHSSCSNVVGTSNPGFNGYPGACGGTDGSYPYGPWAKVGIQLEGTNITTKNLWVHRIGNDDIFFPGNVANWNSTNDRFTSGASFLDDGGSMTFSGNNSMTNDVWAFGGCAEKYPTPDPGNVKNLNNYLNCCDQNCGALGGGFMMQNNNNESCGNWTISNSQFLFNMKTNIDFLHCDGSGTFNFYRSRTEGSTGEALKLNVTRVNIENSQIIGNAPVWSTAPFQAILAPYSVSNGTWTPLICRGGAVTLFAGNPGEQVNILNSDVEGNCSALIETGVLGTPSSYACPGMSINSRNSKYIAGYDAFANRGTNVDLFYNGGNDGNGAGACGTGAVPLNSSNDSVYNESDPSDCSGSHDLCGNDPQLLAETSDGGNIANIVGPASYYNGTSFGDQLYLQSSSPLKGAGATGLNFTNGSSNDYNNNPQNSSPDIGAVQYNSCIADNNYCSISGQCCDGNCNAEGQCGTGSTSSQPVVSNPSSGSGGGGGVLSSGGTGSTSNSTPGQPVVTIINPGNGSSFPAGSNVTITATASEANGNIAKVSFYYNGSNFLGTDTTPPYSYTANDVSAGSYTVTAIATDTNGVSVISNVVAVTATASGAPAVTAAVTNPVTAPVTTPPVTTPPVTTPVTPPAGNKSAPVVSITSPSNGSTYTTGSNITISASAAESNGSIAKVSFYYNGSNFLGTDTTPPYSYTANDVSAGNYTVTAVATDTNGVSTTSSPVAVTVAASANQAAPVVNITNPSNGSTIIAGSNVTITASASENNGNIAKVDFYYNGSNFLGTDTTAPYSYTAKDVSAGNYTVTAIATDTNGVATTSSPISVTVTAPASHEVPVVSITGPPNGSTFTAGSNITISAIASENNGSIAKVDFYYNGTNLLGTDTTAPYTYTSTNVSAGNYTVTAVATDTNGASTTSSVISVTVTSPVTYGASAGNAGTTVQANTPTTSTPSTTTPTAQTNGSTGASTAPTVTANTNIIIPPLVAGGNSNVSPNTNTIDAGTVGTDSAVLTSNNSNPSNPNTINSNTNSPNSNNNNQNNPNFWNNQGPNNNNNSGTNDTNVNTSGVSVSAPVDTSGVLSSSGPDNTNSASN